MSLFVHLALRLLAVVLLSLTAMIGWVLVDAHRAIEADTRASAERAALALRGLFWRELLWNEQVSHRNVLPVPEWRSVETLKVIAPGVCVTFIPGGDEASRLCSQVAAIGAPAPRWFAAAYQAIFGTDPPVRRVLAIRRQDAGMVVARPDPEAAVRQAWRQVGVVVSVAALMALGIGLLAALVVCHALMPTRIIVAGLRRLESGDFRVRLPHCPTSEFGLIARAVNDLTGRLADTMAERAALTSRLFEVQEEERRALARDLHDEFGQCLAATGALAAAIEGRAAASLPELARDARSITAITRRMMTTLRGTLDRLRSQALDDLGLEGSLAQLVSGWNAQRAPATVFRAELAPGLGEVPQTVALNLYRMAQEFLTNAVRHGTPREVRLRLEYASPGGGAILLSVEDDGGGDASAMDRAAGRGVLGVRERTGALGGRLSIEQAPRGLRITVAIPLAPAAADARAGRLAA